jgi:hypothetical protein
MANVTIDEVLRRLKDADYDIVTQGFISFFISVIFHI